MSLAQAKKYFNKYIRLRDSNNGYCKCVTCGAIKHWKDCDAGHFIHNLDFVEINQNSQCKQCNMHLHGNETEYTLFMIDKYGREEVDKLRIMRKRNCTKSTEQKRSAREWKEVAKHYRDICKNMESAL